MTSFACNFYAIFHGYDVTILIKRCSWSFALLIVNFASVSDDDVEKLTVVTSDRKTVIKVGLL